ncbi:MAG: sigma factor, ECF subfamily protein [Gemmatimonadota bacterium]|nr:sigma factor, ECF subfamily protein [Gemmatimonadota bacterium]
MHNLALAEDVVQDAFLRALDVWKQRGVPENPSAWLMATAKNRALDILRRERTARTYAPELGRLLESEWTLAPAVAEAFGDSAIRDDQLRIMFSCCHPQLPEIAQVALILNILCGFGVNEVAAAFLTGHAAMEKRITRGKKVLAGSKRLFDLSDQLDLPQRLSAVQRALYLLFNEGYHGAHAEVAVRAELCVEAMRLAELLLAHPVTTSPATEALIALMCFNAARLPARIDASGNLSALYEQDRRLWNRELIAKGVRLLDHSATGSTITEFHIEAAIASIHSRASSLEDTHWPMIVSLYDTLLTLRPSPVVALNRAIAVAQHEGAQRGLEEIEAIAEVDRLTTYPFYFAALAELEQQLGRTADARAHFLTASQRARNPMERNFFDRRAEELAH